MQNSLQHSLLTHLSLILFSWEIEIVFTMHKCGTSQRWVNSLRPSGNLWHHSTWSSLVQIIVDICSVLSLDLNQWWLIVSWMPWNKFNSLAPARSECNSTNGIFNLVLLTGIFRSSHDNALQWMPQDLTDDKSTLVQVMAWCRQATSHYLT